MSLYLEKNAHRRLVPGALQVVLKVREEVLGDSRESEAISLTQRAPN